MGDKYMVYISKYPYKGYWEGMRSFNKFGKAVRFARRMMWRGYEIIDIQCRDIKEIRQ